MGDGRCGKKHVKLTKKIIAFMQRGSILFYLESDLICNMYRHGDHMNLVNINLSIM